MNGGIGWLFLGCPLCLALLLASIGTILRLCESSWEKNAGELGSHGFFISAAMLILVPIAVAILLRCI